MTVSDQIIAVLDSICAKFGVVIDWTQENVLPYVTELAKKFINYEIATSVAWFVFFLISFVVCGFITKALWKKAKTDRWNDENLTVGVIVATITFAFIAIAFVIVTAVQTIDIITCITFPEKMIFEYIKQFTTTSA